MGKASSSKKVARAASTGGGRTSRGARPWGWYLSMTLIALLGTVVIVQSRNERQAASNPLKSEKPRPPSLPGQKKFAGDHWHAAYGIYICSEFVSPIQSDADPKGIHTHNDGLVHIHPFTKAASGRNATFGVFADTVGLEVTATSIKVPGGDRYDNGKKCPDGKKGNLHVYLNGDERTGNPKKLRLRDRDLLVIAFAPDGVDVPKDPPSKAKLDSVSDLPGAEATSTTVAPAEGSTTTAPGSSSTTAAPETSSTTAAPTPSSTP